MDWRNLTLKEIAAALSPLALLVVLALRWAFFPRFPGGPNNGFGSEWECTPQPKGDPICVKRLPK
jgi:hypothetical protein